MITSICILVALTCWIVFLDKKPSLEEISESIPSKLKDENTTADHNHRQKSVKLSSKRIEEVTAVKQKDIKKANVAAQHNVVKRVNPIEEQRTRKIRLAIEKINVPIEFWGRVVDHSGKSLEGVTINYRVGQPRVVWDTNTVQRNTTTDTNGKFYISDMGTGFSFESINKEGYRITTGQTMSYSYNENSGKNITDQANPKIYTLIEEDKIQGLLKSSKTLMLAWDGIPVYYDVKSGLFGKSGEIKITAHRGEIEGKGRKARYDWSFKIEVPHGGIIATTRESAFLAPEEGYEPAWEYGLLSSDENWGSGKQGDVFLFFKLSNGNYGQLKINFYTELTSQFSGNITSYFNPSGGRILEYDGRLRIKP